MYPFAAIASCQPLGIFVVWDDLKLIVIADKPFAALSYIFNMELKVSVVNTPQVDKSNVNAEVFFPQPSPNLMSVNEEQL